MDALIYNEIQLKEAAERHNVVFAGTNEDVARELLRRNVLDLNLKQPIATIQETQCDTYSISWEAMSCYLDAIVFILLQETPQLDNFLWEMLTHKQHPVQQLCENTIGIVRETWRQTLFALLQKKRVSLRPFLSTLKKCESMISEKTPFWTSCLNDPLEFIQNVMIPILIRDPSRTLIGRYHERKMYTVQDGHKAIEAEVKREKEPTDKVVFQMITLSENEVQGGDWFTQPSTFTVLKDTYEGEAVYKTRPTWEFNGNLKMFIQHKGTPDERRVPEDERTDEIGSRIMEVNTTSTPFHPKSEVIVVGIQRTKPLTHDIPLTIRKDREYQVAGVVLYKNRHYTALCPTNKGWHHYDSMRETPNLVTTEAGHGMIRNQVRAVFLVGL